MKRLRIDFVVSQRFRLQTIQPISVYSLSSSIVHRTLYTYNLVWIFFLFLSPNLHNQKYFDSLPIAGIELFRKYFSKYSANLCIDVVAGTFPISTMKSNVNLKNIFESIFIYANEFYDFEM